jgi:hypothetical protein
MEENKPALRRSLRFGIRDVLWTMLVVGLVLGWWMDRRNFRHSESILLHMVTEARMEAENAQYEVEQWRGK